MPTVEVVLDLLVLDPIDWGEALLPAGMPLTLSMKVPPDVAGSITAVTDRWAASCEVLAIGVGLGSDAETVLLDGRTDQLVPEIVDPPTGCPS